MKTASEKLKNIGKARDIIFSAKQDIFKKYHEKQIIHEGDIDQTLFSDTDNRVYEGLFELDLLMIELSHMDSRIGK